MAATLKALVLSGGRSKRMGHDKAAITYAGLSQLERAVELAGKVTPAVFVSVRPDQVNDPLRSRFPQIVDREMDLGPAAGIRAAQHRDPAAAWLVLACDLPLLEESTLRMLVASRDPARVATAFRSSHDGLPEPLCTIYEPAAAALFDSFLHDGRNCPRKFLINSDTLLLDQPAPYALDNVNTPEEMLAARQKTQQDSPARELRVQYFALLREQAQRRDETVVSHASTPLELYAELSSRYHFTLPHDMLKVAINSEFAEWSQPLRPGDSVVFIPPVAGG